MSFTTARTARKVAPYRPPSFFDREDRRDDRPSQARPPSAPERRPGFLPVTVEGVRGEMRLDTDRHHPGLGTAQRLVFDFHHLAGLQVLARVVTYPDGARCTCETFGRWRECGHVLALIEGGHIPDVRRLDQVRTWTVAGPEGGGA